MSIQIGDINVSSKLLENEFRITVLERVIDVLIRRFPSIGGPPITPSDMARIRGEVVHDLKRKYPKARIEMEQT